MKYWIQRVVKPFSREFDYRRICEIGASHGGATDLISAAAGISVVVIDPCLDTDLCAKYRNEPNVKVYSGLSLDVLPTLTERFDCFLVDGDHNWYTVFNELQTIQQRGLLREGGAVFLHDIDWPYGRRDMYYQPEKIPPAFVKPYVKSGIVRGDVKLSSLASRNAEYCNAEEEGGPKNGVLTAIEDFMTREPGNYILLRFWDERGLGVLLNVKGVKSNGAVLKWRLKCNLFNFLIRAKRTLRKRAPFAHRLLKSAKVRIGRIWTVGS